MTFRSWLEAVDINIIRRGDTGQRGLVYKNPTPNELKSLFSKGDARGMVVPDGTLYAWDGEDGVHADFIGSGKWRGQGADMGVPILFFKKTLKTFVGLGDSARKVTDREKAIHTVVTNPNVAHAMGGSYLFFDDETGSVQNIKSPAVSDQTNVLTRSFNGNVKSLVV